MARKDKTFTSGDIVRFWCDNLDREEQKWVTIFFLTVVPGIYFTNDEILDIMSIVEPFIKGTVIKLIFKVITRYMKVLRRISHFSWVEIIFDNPKLRKEIEKCILKRTQDLKNF